MEKNTLSIKKLYWSNDDKIDTQESILYYFEKNWDVFFEEKNSSKLIKSLSNIKFADFADSFDNRNSINRISNNISKKLQSNSIVKKNEIIKVTKEVFLGENVEKSISKLSENQILSFSIKKLPDNIQSLIIKIESNCQKLNGVKDIEIQHVVDQTIDKLLPETLKKYSLMDNEYKTTMKNKDGKSAQDLLIESLNNMNDKLINIIHSESPRPR